MPATSGAVAGVRPRWGKDLQGTAEHERRGERISGSRGLHFWRRRGWRGSLADDSTTARSGGRMKKRRRWRRYGARLLEGVDGGMQLVEAEEWSSSGRRGMAMVELATSSGGRQWRREELETEKRGETHSRGVERIREGAGSRAGAVEAGGNSTRT